MTTLGLDMFQFTRAATLSLLLTICFSSGSASAASYILTDLTVVDPILDNLGNTHPYEGNDLGPFAILIGADLREANLSNADLAGANLNSADLADVILAGAGLSNADLTLVRLRRANLAGADLTGANLTAADLRESDLSGADFRGAILANAIGLMDENVGTPQYDASTDFTGAWADDGITPFDPVVAGWTLVEEPPVLVPEPSHALLMGLGLMGLAIKRG